MPKQFIDFFGTGRTLLQQTYDRFVRFIPADHIFVTTYEGYVSLVQEQLPELPVANIFPEPVQLNTAPASIWATWHAVLINPNANVIVTPADQLIQHDDLFEEQILKGLDFVDQHDDFLAMGVRPTLPNTAYGYIQMGDEVDKHNLYRVKSFTEKPEDEYARLFLESGEFLWNTGIFMWKGQTMGKRLDQLVNRPSQPVEVLARQMLTIADEMEYVRSTFTESVPRQLDLFILEQCENVVVQECNFGWADIGCWPEMHEVSPHDADGNAVSGGSKVLFSGTQRCMVRLPKQMKAVVAGLDGFLVVQEGDHLMICPNQDVDYIRRLINEAQIDL
ncbi:mannose-1-phosphate guanylyltransferase (GDP) [gut metagenome]|uniref:Mannose-1-phosphate guanylyltransferase (GDP) n=1 Tax=gut metagenome TaxID=749906 RepID=J9GG95_9ZZZZ